MTRIYNRWAGNPRGVREQLDRCVAQVSTDSRSMLFHQCLRKRGKGTGEYKGLLCGIHANQQTKGRNLWVPKEEG